MKLISTALPAWRTFAAKMTDVVLPFWAASGFLDRYGMYCERTDLAGRPLLDVPHRSMVQARQIFVYTHAERTGQWRGGGEKAMVALDTLLQLYSDDGDLSRGLAFSIGLNGSTVSTVRDAYAHAFILFALASAYRLNPDPKFRNAAEAIVAFVDMQLIDKQHGGLFESYPRQGTVKLQNPLMHLLEASLALHEAWPDRGHLDRAGRIVALFRDRLFRSAHGVLLERYASDWSAAEPPEPSTFFEPGHQFEWAWLLQWYDGLAGTDHGNIADRLWRSACEKGVGPDGLCFDEVAFDAAFTKRNHRAWPHTEGIKAAGVRIMRGDVKSETEFAAFLTALNSVFLVGPFPGGWLDRVDVDGNRMVDVVPASTLYHLYSALVEASRSIG